MDRQILRSAGLLRPTEANKILSPCATSSRQNSEPFGIADEARRVSPRKPVKALTGRVANTSGGSYHPAKAGIFMLC